MEAEIARNKAGGVRRCEEEGAGKKEEKGWRKMTGRKKMMEK